MRDECTASNVEPRRVDRRKCSQQFDRLRLFLTTRSTCCDECLDLWIKFERGVPLFFEIPEFLYDTVYSRGGR